MDAQGSMSVIQGKYESVTLFRRFGGREEAMIELVGEAFMEMVRGYRYYTEGSEREIIALLTLIAIREEKATAFLGYDKMEGGKGNRHYLLKIGEAESPLLHWKLECEGIIIWEEMIHLAQKDKAEKIEQP